MIRPASPLASLPSSFGLDSRPIRRPRRVGFLLLGAVILFGAPHPAAGQEVRFGLSYAFPNIQGVPDSWGDGFGARWVGGGGVGFGIDYDRFSSTQGFRGPTCLEIGNPDSCTVDDLAFDSEMDLVTLILIGEMIRTEDWRLRIMVGRTAGSIRGSGTGLTTGGITAPPPADFENSILSWDRGADGSIFGFELLRPLPWARVPLDLRLSIRSHRMEMHGCEVGDYSPFCGNLSMTEVQIGALLRWPRGNDPAR